MSIIGAAISAAVAGITATAKQVKKNKEFNKNLVTMETAGKDLFGRVNGATPGRIA